MSTPDAEARHPAARRLAAGLLAACRAPAVHGRLRRLALSSCALAALMLPALMLPALAQGTSDPAHGDAPAAATPLTALPLATTTGTADGPAPDSTATGGSGVDDTALRYFIKQGDMARARAELERLHLLHPDWEPPASLFNPGARTESDEQAAWDLLAAGKGAEARSAVSQRQSANPDWKPSAALLRALDAFEARSRLINAATASQWRTVLSTADQLQDQMDCDHADILWAVAEAYARTDQTARALDSYRFMMKTCGQTALRVATLQKAMTTLPAGDFQTLLQQVPQSEREGADFSAVELDLARRAISAANDQPDTVAPMPQLEMVATAARKGDEDGARDATLLGYYAYRHNDLDSALAWFDFSLGHGGGAKAAEGYVLALHAMQRSLDAEPIAYKWRDASTDNMAAYVTAMTTALTTASAVKIDQPVLDRFAAVVGSVRSPLGAQAIAWYALNSGQPGMAADWFRLSVEWQRSEVAVYGLGLAYQDLGDRARFDALIRAWTPVYPRLPVLYAHSADALPQDLSDARSGMTEAERQLRMSREPPTHHGIPMPDGTMAAVPGEGVSNRPVAVAGATTAARSNAGRMTAGSGGGQVASGGSGSGGGSGGGAVARGWQAMRAGRAYDAVNAFSQATGEEAAYGLSLAYMRLGMTSQATAAASAVTKPAWRSNLNTALASAQANAAFTEHRYEDTIRALDARRATAEERADLMMLRGWALYHSGDLAGARAVFEAANAAAPSSASQRALNVVSQRMLPRQFRDP